MSKGHITILSCGIGTESLTDQIKQQVSKAEILAGGQRLLTLFPNFTGEKIVIGKCAGETIGNIVKMVLEKNKNICVLASGDSLFHGIGKTFAKQIPSEQMAIIPNITAMQAMAAELCLPWDQIHFFSVHGNRDGVLPLRPILAAKVAMIYADPKCPAAKLAKLLLEQFPEKGERPVAIGQNLGLPEAQISKGSLLEMAQIDCSGLSILVILPDHNPRPSLPLGLPDDQYSHQKNLITHPEIRAVALAKLRLGDGVMWDIGAGSGSVGLEAAGLCPELEVFAIEKNTDRIKDIEANIKNFGVANVKIKNDNALEVIDELPTPRAVFVGGGGNDVSKILEKSFAKLLPGGILVATAVLLETRIALSNTLKDNCTEVVSISVSRAKTLGTSRMMKSDNNIEMYVYRKQG